MVTVSKADTDLITKIMLAEIADQHGSVMPTREAMRAIIATFDSVLPARPSVLIERCRRTRRYGFRIIKWVQKVT